ncbi:putativelike family protein [Ilyonectria robusta]
MATVIIFGASGDVGSAAAIGAAKRGAKVWLALRDPSKEIPAITRAEQEHRDSFNHIQADLSDAASVKEAVAKSGAKAAFVYNVQTQDFMRGTFEAIKDASIEYVVFLSVYSILPGENTREIKPEHFISYPHAQAENSLEDIGLPFTALRPAMFASNAFKLNLDQSQTPWEAHVPNVGGGDCISPIDIGEVAGAILVNPVRSVQKNVVYLTGPKFLSHPEMYEIMGRVLGREIKVTEYSADEYGESLKKRGVPAFLADFLADDLKKNADRSIYYPEPFFSQCVANVEQYTGRKATSFEDYVRARGAGQ